MTTPETDSTADWLDSPMFGQKFSAIFKRFNEDGLLGLLEAELEFKEAIRKHVKEIRDESGN